MSQLVNLQEEYKKRQIQEVLDQLDKDLIGLIPVKTRIKEIAALLLVHVRFVLSPRKQKCLLS
jgi:hypothetical protein